mmetsp:Transcript_19107/g.41363  ORF Transcript_19107/g.41363 Transcript_19107/m.41363 type:complete len:211 (-) Transcript_19107:166-798(-)
MLSNMTNSYQHQPSSTEEMDIEDINITHQSVTHHTTMTPRRTPLLIGFGSLLLVTFIAIYASVKENATPSDLTSVDMLGRSSPSSASACTFKECSASRCNHEVAPFTCLFHNGGVHGGCSPIPWTVETCTTQCDLTGCDDLDIPDDVEDCDVQCSDEWCTMGGQRLCGSTAQYQCMVGSSAFGCSDDRYQWTFRTSDASCSSCCNADTCE